MAKRTPQRRPAKTTGSATTDERAKRAPASGRRAGRNAGAAGATVPPAEPVAAVALNRRTEAGASTGVAGAAMPTAKRPAPGQTDERDPSHRMAPASAVPATAARRNRTSGSSLAAAAFGGGIVALAGMALLQWAGLFPGQPQQDFAREEQVVAVSQEVSALRQAVSQMEEALDGAPDDSESAALAEYDERITAIEAALPEESEEPDATAQALETLLNDFQALREEQDRLAARLDTTESEIAARLDGVEAELAEPGVEQELARAFAAAALKSAIDRGGSFAAELEAYRAFAADDPAIDALAPLADQGVPSAQALAQRFPQVSRDILAATREEGTPTGPMDRLMNSARSLVTLRQTGEVEGETPEAAISRIEAQITAGDFAAARLEWDELPEAGREASAEFGDDLKARAEADRVLDQSLAAAADAAAPEGTN